MFGSRVACPVVPPEDNETARDGTQRGGIKMFNGGIDTAHPNHNRTKGCHLVPLLIAFAFAITVFPTRAHAQIIGELEANIPFQFHAGDAKLPAGTYIIRVLGTYDLSLMEISSVDGSASALFTVRDAEANSAPAKNELIFNKYGNRYFLAKMFDEGNPNGSKVDESRYEKTVSQATAEAQAHVPAFHRGQQKN
jgi:hypothetical protein